MARIPDAELERLKREVSLARLIEGQGHKLTSQGKDLACRCPWHDGDDTPSCIVSPKTNLWDSFHCTHRSCRRISHHCRSPARCLRCGR
jgi:DNA primase